MQNGPRFLTMEDLNNYTSTQNELLGAVGMTGDGRTFQYVYFGGTSTINPGLVLVGPAAPANSTGLAIPSTQPNNGTSQSALAAGSTTFNVTNGSTAVTANQFQYVEIVVSAGGLYKLRVNGHNAAGNAGTITLSLVDPIPQNATTLIAGTDTVNLRYSLSNQPTASTTAGAPVGVTVNAVPNTSSVQYYGWLLTSGPAYLNATGAIAAGAAVSQDTGGTAGYVVTAASNSAQVGVAQYAAANNRVSVDLNLGI